MKILEIGPSEIHARGGMVQVIRDIRESGRVGEGVEI